ncbi:MAG: isoprenylcysteine carboxylmethyltransferase family protein, partial [Methylococcales bacterium]
MTAVRLFWLLLCVLWIIAEIKLARKHKLAGSAVTESEHRSQRVLWLTVLASLGAALVFKNLAWLPIAIDYLPRQGIALLVFAAGLYLRYRAVSRLGRFFTTDVLIHQEHQLISDGPYRWLRHPAYTGLLLAFIGVGLAMGDGLALLTLTLANFVAFKFRITIEEAVLNKKFGSAYR